MRFSVIYLVVSCILAGNVRARGEIQARWTSNNNGTSSTGGDEGSDAQRPNVLIILTDDQDGHMGTVDNMPKLQDKIINQGAYHPNHYCTIALCCPSRASLWTGLQGHNHNVTDVGGPYGGYSQVVREGHNDDYFFLWMQAAGYSTYYAGKLWNGQTAANYNKPFARGFNHSDLFVGGKVYVYYNVSHSEDQGPIQFSDGYYSTDLIGDKFTKDGGWIDQAKTDGEPWLMVAAPVTPHVQIGGAALGGTIPPVPAKKYESLFNDYKIPRTPDFNPDTPGGASYYRLLPKLNDTLLDYNDEFQRQRLRALQSVDEMIENIVDKLESTGQLDNTYVIFTTDNGFHISQHRLLGGKECGLETDIRIPFAVRGPGIKPGSTNSAVTNHIDMAATLLALTGSNGTQGHPLDGGIMPWTDELASVMGDYGKNEHTSVEFWGNALSNHIGGISSIFGPQGYHNNTYTSVRVVAGDYSFYYSVWCTNEHEVYEMKSDPYQLNNLYYDQDKQDSFQFQGRGFNDTMARLDALLLSVKACKGEECVYPWKRLIPSGEVGSLADAMDKKYDDFFTSQPKVSYTECLLGHLVDAEGPQNPDIYQESMMERSIYESGPLLWS